MATQAEIRARRAEYAHRKEPKNLAGPNWAMTPVGRYFKDGAVNRDPHGSATDAPRTSAMGRTVVVEHRHYRATDKDDQ